MKPSCLAAAAFLLVCLTTSLSAIAFDKTHLSSAAALTARKQWPEAARQIQLYRQGHPESVEAAVLQAEIWIHLGLLSDASGILQRLLSVHPRSIEALSASAYLSRTLGDKTTAETLLLRCTRYAPRSAEVWKRLGDFYLSLGRKEALSAFQHCRNAGAWRSGGEGCRHLCSPPARPRRSGRGHQRGSSTYAYRSVI